MSENVLYMEGKVFPEQLSCFLAYVLEHIDFQWRTLEMEINQ
jgi:hypothetical protein